MHQSKPTRSLPADLARFLAPEIRAWRGQAPLSTVFWFYGVLVSAGLIALFAVSLYRGPLMLEQVLLVCCGLYTAWVLVSIWRCSLTGDPFWGGVARVLTVFWAANAALGGLFLLLELLAHYAGN